MNSQRELFGPPSNPIDPPNFPEDLRALAAELPRALSFGTMSWTFPGWAGHVYRAKTSVKRLVDHGLVAYAKHPLLSAVEIDRTYYEPISAELYANYAAQTPDHFRFIAKAHDECTLRRFPPHERFGKKRGEINPNYLDPQYASDACVAPFVEGLGAKAGALLFQFAPQPELGEPAEFAEKLHKFLAALPKGPNYCVELRNAPLFTRAYGAALVEAGALHCHNVWSAMPNVLEQAKKIPPIARRPLIIRWLLRRGDTHRDAVERYQPFDRLVEEDPTSRAELTELITKALDHDVPVMAITVTRGRATSARSSDRARRSASFMAIADNKAEGCAPASIVLLARAIVRRSKVAS